MKVRRTNRMRRMSRFDFFQTEIRAGATARASEQGFTPRSRSAFTLMELVISGSLMAIIMVSAYVCLTACLESQRVIEPRVEIFQNARVAMSLLAADLRSACVLSSDAEFVGMRRTLGDIPADNLDFATRHYTPRRPREGDYCQVSYFVDRDRETGQYALFRRRNPTIGLDPFSGGRREKIATGVVGVRFEYYDGFEWYDSWGNPDTRRRQQFSSREQNNATGLPEAVRVTIMFDPNPRTKKAEPAELPEQATEQTVVPLVFQTVARLDLAAAARRGTSPSSNTDGGTTGTGVSGQGTPASIPEGGGG